MCISLALALAARRHHAPKKTLFTPSSFHRIVSFMTIFLPCAEQIRLQRIRSGESSLASLRMTAEKSFVNSYAPLLRLERSHRSVFLPAQVFCICCRRQRRTLEPVNSRGTRLFTTPVSRCALSIHQAEDPSAWMDPLLVIPFPSYNRTNY